MNKQPHRWGTLEEAADDPGLKELIPNVRAWYWELGKKHFMTRMIEEGVMLKIGKHWRVSLNNAKPVIEAIYLDRSLSMLKRRRGYQRSADDTEGGEA